MSHTIIDCFSLFTPRELDACSQRALCQLHGIKRDLNTLLARDGFRN